MLKETIGKNGKFIITFENYYGSGWKNEFNQVIHKINPSFIKDTDIEISWDFSEYEILFKKDNIEVKVEIDDLGPMGFILQSPVTDINKQKMREWAIIIDLEIEKLNK